VIDEVTAQHDIDPRRIFIYSWSSAGPAAYEITFANPKVRGAFIAAAVYRRDWFSPPTGARGKAFFLMHSRTDELIDYRAAENAYADLWAAGAQVLLYEYQGIHGDWPKKSALTMANANRWLESESE
jgi:predicted esterase